MTIKKFCSKYDLPYQIVYNATWGLTPYENGWRDKEYDEELLKQEVTRQAEERVERNRLNLEKAEKILSHLKSK